MQGMNHCKRLNYTHVPAFLLQIKDLGCLSGVVLNPGTPLTAIEHVLDVVDLVLIMSVNPGFGGQGFIESQVAKTRALKQMCLEKVGFEAGCSGCLSCTACFLVDDVRPGNGK